ncbi:MAG: glycosyltransferase [Clostridia bacterium]|nr:glycosyltransferase [Clostridia bacterium]
MKQKQTVSLCVIARDEEELILSCINSVRYLVDRVVVVDTGSTDQTAKVATGAGAEVFAFTWTDNFAEARNYALEQTTSDWILVLDADETLEPVGVEDFQRLLSIPDIEGYFLHIRNYLGTGRDIVWDQVVRLFRNSPAYRFSGAIHEQVAPAILSANGGKGLAGAPLVVNHYGYLSTQVTKKGKPDRNTSIINNELERNPDDPFLLHCLAVEHYQQGRVAAGLECLEKALVLMRETDPYFQDAVLNTALGLLSLGRSEKLIDHAGRYLEVMPGQPDLILLRAMGHLQEGRFLEAVEDLDRTLHTEGRRILPTFRVLSLIGDGYNLAGHYAQAEKAYLAALNESGRFLYPLTQLLGLIQAGKSSCRFNTISRFAPLSEKMAIFRQLRETDELPAAVVILLLSMLELVPANVQDQSLVRLSEEFSRILPYLQPFSRRPASFGYLSAAASETLIWVLALQKGYESSSFPVRKSLYRLLEKSLSMVIAEYCPQWSPRPFSLDCLHNQSESKPEWDNQRKPRVLVASPVRQKPSILAEFLESLEMLDSSGLALDFAFVDDNIDIGARNLLAAFVQRRPNVRIIPAGSGDVYLCDETTHHWRDDLIWKVAAFKNGIISIALNEGYNFLFLVDSDLYLHPNTVRYLVSLGKHIVSEVFWTKWQPNLPAFPQVWVSDQYRLHHAARGEVLSEEEAGKRMAEFLEMLSRPGTYRVGGLGACTLISRKALAAGVSFNRIYNLDLAGEDRHFCIRAVALGLELYADTHYPPFHIYRESELEGLKAYKASIMNENYTHHD